MSTAEGLLSKVQGSAAAPCASSAACASAANLQSLSSQLAVQLTSTTQNFIRNHSEVEIMKLADGAVLALDLGQSSTTLSAPWRTVTPATRYSSALGYGWSANSTVHWGNSSTNDVGLQHPFSQYIAGAAAAELWIDLAKPGNYIATVVVGLWDRSRKSAVTEVRDAAIGINHSQRRILAPAQRVHSGVFQPRTFQYRVGPGEPGMRLAMLGNAIGPEISQVNQQAGSDAKCVSREGWVINAIIVHESPPDAGSVAHESLALNTLLRSTWINDWAAIGPFNDSNTTGLDRRVSTAEGDTRLAELHRAKSGKMVGWRRTDANGAVAIAALLGSDDGLGSAAILQTSVFCAVPTNATAVVSTSGTGTLSLNGAVIGIDEVYAGLLQQELVIDLSFHQGWSTFQLKSLSHLAHGHLAAAWSATVALITRELPRRPLQGCKVSVCAEPSQHLAPVCRSTRPM